MRLGRHSLPDLLTDLFTVGVLTGTTDVDISAAVYTGYTTLLSVEAPEGGLRDCTIVLDLTKATTGLDDVATVSDTFDCCVEGAYDGTDYSFMMAGAQITANGDGSLLNNESGWCFIIGPMVAGAIVRVKIALSAERADAEIPYWVTYVGKAPTVTAIAAG